MAKTRLQPSDADAILPVSIGTAIWLVALIGLALNWSTLESNDATWWVGAAAVGFVSGALGVVFLRWRRARMDRRVTPA